MDQDGKLHYILAASGMKQGQKITSGAESAIETGNRLAIKDIPVGSTIHAIELKPGRGAIKLVRSAGNGAQLMAKEENYAQVRLPSGEVRLINVECTASIGVLGKRAAPERQNR